MKQLRRLLGAAIALLLMPIGLAMNLLLFIVLLITGVIAKLNREEPEPDQAVTKLEASIVVPSWNGRHLLEECLPALYRAINFAGGDHEIIVVDNGSTDGSSQYIADNFPEVRVIHSKENLGFGGAANLGIRAGSKDLVVLINNDMVVEENFLPPLLGEFKGNPDVFAVTSQILFRDEQKRREETGKTGAYLRHGVIYPWHETSFDPLAVVPVTYAGGGSSAYDRKKLMALGGFDDIYHPFYVEDLDLSFDAWKRGWRVLFQPHSVVYHQHRATIGTRFSPNYIQSVIRKNEIVFVWKNIDSLKNLAQHFLWLWLRLVLQTARGSFEFTSAYFNAIKQLGVLMERRFDEQRKTVLSDEEVFSRSTSLGAYREVYGPPKTVVKGKPLRILFVCPYIPYPPSHGGAVRMWNLLKQLAQEHQVYLLSFIENEQERSGLDRLKQYCVDVKLILRQETWRRDNPLWLRPQSSLNEFYSAEFEQTLQQMVNRYDIDIVQYEYTQMAQYIKKFPRAKNVLTEHDITFVTRYRHFRGLPWSKEKLRAFIRWAAMFVYEPEMCRKFDLVCTVSSKDKELLHTYDHRIAVSDAAPTGADTTFYRPEERTSVEPKSLLFVGFFKHLPNVEGILYFGREIYPLIKDKVPGVKLYIVGANPPADVKELADDPTVEVTGFVQDLREYYARGAIFIVPILRGAGTRVKIYEAMAAGIPVISTPLGAEGIAVTDGKDILLADTPQKFAEKVIALLENEEAQSEMAKAARELVVEKYEWANIAKRLADEYYALWQPNPKEGRIGGQR